MTDENEMDIARTLTLGILGSLAAQAKNDFPGRNGEMIAAWLAGFALEVLNDGAEG